MFCPALSLKKVREDFKSLTSRVGENLAYYLWNKYEGDMSLIDQAILDIPSFDSNDAPAFVFRTNPEISEIGTQEEYELYVSEIFPDSEVKTVYWHGSDSDFSNGLDSAKRGKGSGAAETGSEMYFNRQPWASLLYITGVNRSIPDKEGFNNWVKLWWQMKEILGNGRMDTDAWKHEIIGENTRQQIPNKKGIFNRKDGSVRGDGNGTFLSERKAEFGYENKTDKEFFEEVFGIRYGQETFDQWVKRNEEKFKQLWTTNQIERGITPVVINVQNPIREEGLNTYYEEERGLFTQAKEDGNDAILSNKAKNEFGSDVAVVFDPKNNVHFLGSARDVLMFKAWKNGDKAFGGSKSVDAVNKRRPQFTAQEWAVSQRISQLLQQLFPEISREFVEAIEGGYAGEFDGDALKVLLDIYKMGLDTEPHEYAHYYVAMFRNSKLVLEGIKLFGSEEALVQALGGKVVDTEGKTRTWWQKFKDYIKKLLNLNKLSKEMLLAELNDAFLTRKNLSNETSKVSGKFHQTVSEVRNSLSTIGSSITFDPTSHKYTDRATGKELKPVTSLKKELGYDTYDDTNESEAQKARNKEAANSGTLIHKILENLFLGNEPLHDVISDLKGKVLPAFVEGLKTIVNNLKKDYDFVASEAMISDVDAGVAGTVDLILRNKTTGKIEVFDFKTKRILPKGKTLPGGKRLYGFAYATSYTFGTSAKTQYNFQLSMYRRMLKKHGIEAAAVHIIPIVYYFEDEKYTMSGSSYLFGPKGSETSKELEEHPYVTLAEDFGIENKITTRVYNQVTPGSEQYDEMMKEITLLLKKISNKLKTQLRLFQLKGKKTLSDDAARTLEKISENEEFAALVNYLNYAVKQLNGLNKQILARYAHPELGFDLDVLQEYKEIAASYDIVQGLSGLLLPNADKIDKNVLNAIQKACSEINTLQSSIKSAYLVWGRSLYLDSITPHINNVKYVMREAEKKAYKERHPKGDKTDELYDKEVDEYLAKWEVTNAELIRQRTKELLKIWTEVAENNFECTSLGAKFSSVYESADPFIQAMVIEFDGKMNVKDHKLIVFRNRLNKILKEYKEKYGVGNFSDFQKMYEDIIEISEDGTTAYIVNQFDSKFLSAEKKARDEIFGNEELDYKEKQQKWQEWLDLNVPIYDINAYKAEYEHMLISLISESSAEEKKVALENLKSANPESWYKLYREGKISYDLRENIVRLEKELTNKYRKPNRTLYPNTKYAKLQALDHEDPKYKMWLLFTEILEQEDDLLPPKLRLKYRLPAIIRTGAERVATKGVVDQVKHSWRKGTVLMADLDERGTFVDENGNVVNQIPMYYYNNSGISLDEQSFDLPTIFFKWYDAALTYQVKKSMESRIKETSTILAERKTKTGRMSLLLKGQQAEKHLRNTEEQWAAWVDQVFYGNKLDDLGTFKLPFSDKRVDTMKLISTLSSMSSTRIMFGNFTSFINNMLMAEVQQLQEAAAGEFISMDSYTKATKLFMSDVVTILEDINNVVPKSKYNQLADWFNINDLKPNQSLTGFLRHSFAEVGMAGQTFGDVSARYRYMIAALIEEKALDKDGNVLGSLLDFISFDDNGVLIVDDRVANFGKYEQNKFSLKIRRVMMGIHGNYDRKRAAVAVETGVLGKLGLSLRRWVEPGVERRFTSEHYSNLTDSVRKGYVRDSAKYMILANPIMGTLLNFIATNIFRAKEKLIEIMRWKDLSTRSKQNIIRSLVSMSAAAIGLSFFFLFGGHGGDDEPDNLIVQNFRYQMYRLYTDLTFFVLPSSFLKIMLDPFPALSLVDSYMKLMLQLLSPLEEYENGIHNFDNKLLDKLFKLTPGLKQWGRFSNISREMEYFTR